MKNCEKCEMCIAESICASWVNPTSVVCAIFLKAVDAQKTAPNSDSPKCRCWDCNLEMCANYKRHIGRGVNVALQYRGRSKL